MSADNVVVPFRVYVTPQAAAEREKQLRHAQQLADAVVAFEALVIDRAAKRWFKTPRAELDQLAAMARIVKGEQP